MHSVHSAAVRTARPVAHTAASHVYVDCMDVAHQDLLSLWLGSAGYAVHEGLPSGKAGEGSSGGRPDVLVTDRFGPGLAGEVVIAELKARRPGLRVVVIGCGNGQELAQLSLARVAGADATLATPFDREAVLRTLEQC